MACKLTLDGIEAAKRLRSQVYNNLESPDARINKFLRPSRLDSLLSAHGSFSQVLRGFEPAWPEPARPDSSVHEHHILSSPEDLKLFLVFIFIEAPEWFPSFYEALLHARKSSLDLPLINEDAAPIFAAIKLPDTLQLRFLEYQHCFCPMQLGGSNRSIIEAFPRHAALPFVSWKQIGSGGFGRVFKVTVAERCLFSFQDVLHEDPQPAALKILHREHDGDQEIACLRYIAESTTYHPHVAKFLGAFRSQDEVYILLPLMAWGNLEAFLTHGQASSSFKGHQDAVKAFRDSRLSDEEKKLAILDQMANVAGALSFLHNDLITKDRKSIRIAHLDLKPDNILLNPDSQAPLGKWFLADFGVSRVSPGNANSQFLTPTQPADRRREGIYQAPEVLEDISKFSSRSDLWSMGCIFTEVVCFVVGGPGKVDEYRKRRYQRQASPDQCNYGFCRRVNRSSLSPNSRQYELRPQVLDFMKGLKSHNESWGDWTDCVLGLTKKSLKPISTERPSSTELADSIRHVADHFRHNVVKNSTMPFPCTLSNNAALSDAQTSSRLSTPVSPTPAWVLSKKTEAWERQHVPTTNRSRIQDPWKEFLKPKKGLFEAVALNGPATLCAWVTEDSAQMLKAFKVVWQRNGKFQRVQTRVSPIPNPRGFKWTSLSSEGDYIVAGRLERLRTWILSLSVSKPSLDVGQHGQ